MLRRGLGALVALVVLAPLTLTGASVAASQGESKLSPAMEMLVADGGYGDFPIADYVPGYTAGHVYYLAEIEGGLSEGAIDDLERAGATVRFTYPAIGWVALSSSVETVQKVASLGRVASIELDRVHELLDISVESVSGVAPQAKRGTSDVGADVLWSEGVTGEGVLLGVADSGIDSTHPDLDDLDWLDWQAVGTGSAKIDSFVDCTAANDDVGTTCPATPGYDDNGHGTHVSGIAAGSAEGLLGQNGKLPGVAPEAELAGAKVCLAAGSCLNSSVMAGMQYLAAEQAEGGAGADVINMSLGSGRFYLSPLAGSEQVTNSDPEAQLVNALAAKNNVVWTISAGNSGPVIQSLGSPGVASQGIAVGAAIADWDLDHPTAETEHGVYGDIRPEAAAAGATAIAQFSSRGPSGDRLIKPDLTAPGVFYVAAESAEGAQVSAADAAAQHHYAADKAYAVLSGTSMSAPAAAGAAALVIDGYRKYTGTSPSYVHVKTALANTATTRAFEGAVTGLTSSIRVKITGEDPEALRPLRNDAWVGATGEGAGRIWAPAALLAITKGVLVHTAQEGELDDARELQPSWSLDTVPRGHTASQAFVVHGAPGLAGGARMTWSVESHAEASGVASAPAAWFALPKSVKPSAGADTPFAARLSVPLDAPAGLYAATLVGKAKLGQATQTVRIPVQFSVDLVDPDPAAGAGTSVESPIWASAKTDYSAAGFYAEDIYTDWITYPVRLTEGTERVDLSAYDVAGADHVDVFVFDDNGQEIDSSVSFYLDHALPAGAFYAPTTKDDPVKVSILDGDDHTDVVLPTTVWVAVSNSGPASAPGFSRFHLDADVVGGTAGTGTTPAERIHSGAHAWWGGSVGGASSHLTQTVDLTGVPASASPALRFWTWYQLEEGYDWAFALVSTDGGETWTSLATSAANESGTTSLDPIGDTGNTLGGAKPYPNGLTGTSGHAAFTGANLFAPSYAEHSADLTPYAGESIQLRFLYTSDPATNYEGFYVDDVSVVDGTGAALPVGTTNPDDMETTGSWISGGSPGFGWVTADSAG